MVRTRYMPRADGDLLVWLDNFSKQLATYGATVGLDAAGIKALQEQCTAIATAVGEDERAYAGWRAAVAHSAAVKDGGLNAVAAAVAHLDTHPRCTDAIRAALRITAPQTTAQPLALGEHKIPFTLEGLPGRVVVKWRKGGLDGVNVYGQRGGETEWVLLGRDNRPPYDDLRPPTQPGASEVRRYRLVGVVDDREVTPPSDIASISIGG